MRFDGNVVVIHDAAAIRDPDWYSAAYARWQRFALPRIARSARAVITPSSFSRDEIVDLLGVNEAKISVVPGGVDERFSPEADATVVRHALGLDRPYVLTVASRTSRKNLAALGPACSALNEQGIELVAAGGERSGLRDSGLAGAMKSLGTIPDALLPGLYAGAKAFVLPSFHEGFGLTALEAMRSGVPVVVSDAGALPEVCGEAATYVDPNDPAGIAAAVLDAAAREGVDQRAVDRASRFSWEQTAIGVNRVVERALEG